MHDRQSAHPSYWYKSGCVALTRCISTLRFTSSSLNVWLPFQAKNNVRIPPACTGVSHQSHNAHTTNCHLCGKGERNGIQRRTKVSLVEPAMELLRLAKRHISGRSDIEQWRIQPLAIVVIKLRLFEGIREGVSQSVSQSVSQYKIQISREFLKFHSNFLEWVRNDLKTFLSLEMPNLFCLDCHKVKIKLVLGWYFRARIPNFHDPYIQY